jgi:hypothetical protein
MMLYTSGKRNSPTRPEKATATNFEGRFSKIPLKKSVSLPEMLQFSEIVMLAQERNSKRFSKLKLNDVHFGVLK